MAWSPISACLLAAHLYTTIGMVSTSAPNTPFLSRVKTLLSSRCDICLASRLLAYGGLLLVNFLYASFSLLSMAPLSRIDPVLFLCFQMLLLSPLALILLLKTRKQLNRDVLYRGLQLGGFLSVGLLC